MSDPTADPADSAADPAPETRAPEAGESPSTAVQADVETPAADAAGASFGRHPIVLYTLKRLVLLLVVGGVLYLVGVRGLLLILFAFLLSGVIAMVALKDSREGAAYGITHAVQKVNDRIDASSRAEDFDDLDDDLAEVAPEPVAPEPFAPEPVVDDVQKDERTS